MKENLQAQIALNPIASARPLVFQFITCLVFILFNLAFSGSGIAQVKPGNFFVVNSKVKVYPLTDFGSNLGGDKTNFLFAEANQKFTVIDVSDNGIIQIQFWNFKGPGLVKNTINKIVPDNMNKAIANLSAGEKAGLDKTDVPKTALTRSSIVEFANGGDGKIIVDRDVNGKIFTITLKDLNEKCMPYFGYRTSFTFGAMTIPLKIRFGSETMRPMLVEEKLNIGLTPGLKRQFKSRKEQSITLLANIGISNVRTTAETFNAGYTPSSDNEPALSGALGLMYQHEKFQIGILSGQDWLLSDGAPSWKYQSKQWLGIGIGFSFFGQGNGETNPGNNN